MYRGDFEPDIVKLNTGDPYADFDIEHRLARLPEFWALVSYLEGKGVLDRGEFLDCLNQKCAQLVSTAKILKREEDAQEL